MKSMPAWSAMWVSARQSSQLADQRSGTLVGARPDEQFAPNSPSLSVLALYMSRRARCGDAERSSKGFLQAFIGGKISRLGVALHRDSGMAATRSLSPRLMVRSVAEQRVSNHGAATVGAALVLRDASLRDAPQDEGGVRPRSALRKRLPSRGEYERPCRSDRNRRPTISAARPR